VLDTRRADHCVNVPAYGPAGAPSPASSAGLLRGPRTVTRPAGRQAPPSAVGSHEPCGTSVWDIQRRELAVRIGFGVPDPGSWATPVNQVRIAQRAEQLGYHSVWTLQRLLNPADSADQTYRNVPDPLITLAYLAAHTSRVRLGVAVLNMPFFSPPLLA